MSDFWTMVWKETKDSIFSGQLSEFFRPFVVIVIMGVIIPWQFGQAWISLSVATIVIVCYIPFFFTTSYIGDAVAGERERHTLETLLASRISEQAILWAKVAVSIAYAWGLTLIGLLVGLVVVNLTAGAGHWEFYYPLSIFFEMLVFSLLVCLLSASGGVFISLRAATVRQAQQTMYIGTLALLIAIILIFKSISAAAFANLDIFQLLLIFIGGFTVIDLALVVILSASFRRSRLILS